MDSRFKPDIVAPGETISSACAGVKPATDTEAAQAAGLLNHCSVNPVPSVNCALTVESGTSMATPLMAGASECVFNLLRFNTMFCSHEHMLCRYVRQYFLRGFFPSGGFVPLDEIVPVPSALVRATVIAGARQITGTVKDARNSYVPLPSWYPNYAIGFGRAVLDRTLYVSSICDRGKFVKSFLLGT